MKLWLVERTDPESIWDAYLGHVVQAPDEAAARALAAEKAADEGPRRWSDPSQVRCECIGEGPDEIPGVVLSSFMAG